MPASEAQILANRANALKSTGPKTPEGKNKSRVNAIKHGLCCSTLVFEDVATVTVRAKELYQALKPQNDYQAWHVDRAAVASIRIDRCERIERRVRDKVMLRAILTWDDDRRLEAEILGGMLARRPSETVATLRRTPHGCDWLIARWADLAFAADSQADHLWTPEQAELAFDLMGTPRAFRASRKPGVMIDDEGNVLDPGDDPAGLARRRIAELKGQREAVADLDEVERTLVEVDLDHDSDAQLRRLRRYESALHNRYRWSVKEIRDETPFRKLDPGLEPGWSNGPIPTPKVEPTDDELAAEFHPPDSIHPPFCLEPDEYPPINHKPDIPAILHSRKEKRIAKNEARRQARRRKLENMRA